MVLFLQNPWEPKRIPWWAQKGSLKSLGGQRKKTVVKGKKNKGHRT